MGTLVSGQTVGIKKLVILASICSFVVPLNKNSAIPDKTVKIVMLVLLKHPKKSLKMT